MHGAHQRTKQQIRHAPVAAMRQSFEVQQRNKPPSAAKRQVLNSVLAIGPLVCLLLFGAAFQLASPQAKAMAHEHQHHDHHQHDHSAMGDEGMDGMPMPMYFMNTWHTTLWFQGWETTSLSAYVISILGLVLLAIVHEAIACYRSHYLAGTLGDAGALQEPLVGVSNPRLQRPRSSHNEKLCASALYVANITTGYLLMLAVMTFNVGYFVAVIVGMGIGYYLLFEVANKQALNRGDGCHGCN